MTTVREDWLTKSDGEIAAALDDDGVNSDDWELRRLLLAASARLFASSEK
jgi:hypothetical protein